MVIPPLFPQRRELLANYDWTDINNSTGYIKFDCYNTEDSVGTNYSLIHSSYGKYLQPQPLGHTVTVSSSGFQKKFDFDYDGSPLKLPTTLYGKCSIKMAYYHHSDPNEGQSYVIIKLRKWDGSSETEIVSVQSTTNSETNSSGEIELALEFDVPKTLIKKGELIRLTIELWAQHIGAGTTTLRMVGDPQDAAWSTHLSSGNTRITVILPFHIET